MGNYKMADLNDLETKSISDMSPDEAIEYLRQIRLARRVPSKPTPKSTRKKQAKAMPKMTAEQAANLLKLLEEE